MKRPAICNTNPTFRGWTKPGPVPSIPEFVGLAEDESIDALCGHFRIFQLKDGHRFSADDILVAWYGTTCAPSVQRALDLGSGISAVAMTAAWRLPHAHFTTIEAQERSFELAKRSVAYNGLLDRFDMRLGDFRDEMTLGADQTFDLILGSPPYWPATDGVVSEHPQKAACRFELRGDVASYAQVAHAHLNPGGIFACVFPSDQRDRVIAAAETANLHPARFKPVYFDQRKPPRIDLWAMHRKVDLPDDFPAPWQEEPIIIRAADGNIHPMYSALKLSFGFPP